MVALVQQASNKKVAQIKEHHYNIYNTNNKKDMGKTTRQRITEKKVGNAKVRKTVTVTVTKPPKKKRK